MHITIGTSCSLFLMAETYAASFKADALVILLDDINGKFSDNNKVSYSFHK
jgi:hypothetical protein